MNLDEAQTFVEMNSKLISVTNTSSRCIDGRYEGISDLPMVAKPGGDVGDVMALFCALNFLKISLPNETVVDIVVKSVGGPAHFNFDTDDRTEPADVGYGCNHFYEAKTNPENYGVTQEQIDFLGSQLPGLVQQGANQVVLHGNHAEQAVIVVDSETHGVTPLLRLGESLREAFIYQKTLHTQQLDILANQLQEALATAGQVVEQDALRAAIYDASAKQLTETLKLLAKDLPVYTALIDSHGEVSIAS